MPSRRRASTPARRPREGRAASRARRGARPAASPPGPLANGVKHGLADSDRAAYYAPYPDLASRRPVLQWPREIPIDGEPADVAAVITRNGEWLAKTPEVPKLLLPFDGTGLSNAPAVVEWARSAFPNLDVVPLGFAGHHAPEDAPKEIAGAITSWLDRHALKCEAVGRGFDPPLR